MIPASVRAALREHLARGGSVLSASPFAHVALPSVSTPGLANPRGLIGAHHRQHFADGGPALFRLPRSVLAALAHRPHFEDGGEAGGNDRGGSGPGGDGEGGDSSDASAASAASGGPEGFGGQVGGSDGYGSGGGFSPGASSGADSMTAPASSATPGMGDFGANPTASAPASSDDEGDGGLGMPNNFGVPSAAQQAATQQASAVAAATAMGTAPTGSFSQPGQIVGSAPTVPGSGFGSFGSVPGYNGVEAVSGPGTTPDQAGVDATPDAPNTYGVLSPQGPLSTFSNFNAYTGTYEGWSLGDESTYSNPNADTAAGVAASPGALQSAPDALSPHAFAGFNAFQGAPRSETTPSLHAFGGALDQNAEGPGMMGTMPGERQFDRYAYARGGAAHSRLPRSVLAALGHRRHFEDGGEAGGSDRGGAGAGGGDDGGNASGSSGGSSGGSDGYGSSGASGGVGGFGGMSGGNDGYGGGNSGGGFSSGAASGSDSSSSGGGQGGSVGASAGAASGGQSDAATSGGFGGGYGSGYGSATSGAVNSISGSSGAPAAGGFSGDGAAATGGFGSFGATPSASANLSGFSGGLGSASSLDGRTQGQQAAAEAGRDDPGEDGTTSAGAPDGPSLGQAFSNFGPSEATPYGSMANVQQSFGPTAAGDLANVPGLSAAGQQFGALGLGGYGAMAGADGYATGPGAYGLSIGNPNGDMPGFDNFSASGGVQQSSLGDAGYTGTVGATPGVGYSTPGGVMDGSVANVMGNLAEPDGFVAASPAATPTTADLHPGLPDYDKPFSPDYSGFTLGADGQPLSGAELARTAADEQSLLGDTARQLGGLFGAPSTTTGPAPGMNADGDPTAVGGVSALTIHGPMTEAAYGGYDAPGSVSPFGGITDSQVMQARQNIAAGTGTAVDQAIAAGYAAQQASPVGVTPGFGALGAPPASDVAGPGVTAPTPSPASTTQDADPNATGWSFGAYNRAVQGIEDPTGTATNPLTKAYGSYQITPATWNGIVKNNPDQGLPSRAQDASPEQMETAQNDLTSENLGALAAAGLPGTMVNAYVTHLLGAPVGVAALSAPDSTPIGQVVSADAIANNPGLLARGVETVGDMRSRVAGKLAKSGVDPSMTAASSTASAASAPDAYSGIGYGPGTAPGYVSGAGFGMSDFGTASPSPAATPDTTQAVTSAAPYGVSPETAQGMATAGLAPTPANALATDTFGIANAAQVMNGDPSDPVSAVDISRDTVAANPSLFAGVRTIGDLQGNITRAAETAGTTTSTVTTPGAPAAAVSTQPSFAGPLAGAQQDIAGWSQAPSTLPAFAHTAIADPGFAPAAGLGMSPDPASATSVAPAAPTSAPSVPSTSTGTPDTSTPSKLSVPKGVTNAIAGAGLGIFGGPIGAGIAAANGISGLLGGPTIADGVNGLLANSSGGTAGTSGGQGGNSTQAGVDSYGSAVSGYGGPTGTDGGAAPTASSGVDPLDPHATAMAAYQAALAGMSGGTTASGGAYAGTARPLVIHPGRRVAQAAAPLYRPMEDPVVRRALGLA